MTSAGKLQDGVKSQQTLQVPLCQYCFIFYFYFSCEMVHLNFPNAVFFFCLVCSCTPTIQACVVRCSVFPSFPNGSRFFFSLLLSGCARNFFLLLSSSSFGLTHLFPLKFSFHRLSASHTHGNSTLGVGGRGMTGSAAGIHTNNTAEK